MSARDFSWWVRENARSLKAITVGLYQYRFGWHREYRKHMPRTRAQWLFCYPRSVGRDWWFAPRFEARVMDGHGEHYGYPRHYCLVSIWWDHVGYAFGVQFSAEKTGGRPMNWLNIRTEILHSPEFIGSDPTRRATWLSLMLWCAQQENGGIICGSKSWADRRWQQTCGVTAAEVAESCDLFAWANSDLVLWGYNAEKEAEVQERREWARENGRKGGRPRKQPPEKPTTEPTSVSENNQHRYQHPKAEGEGEGERKENENEKGIRIGKEEGGAASPEALPALVLEMPEASKAGAILTFPCSGKAQTWELTDATLAQLRTAYPQIDPLAECRVALAKIQTGAVTRKTASGMPRFLFNWMDRATNSTRNTSPTNGNHRQGFDHRNIATHSDREQLRTFSH